MNKLLVRSFAGLALVSLSLLTESNSNATSGNVDTPGLIRGESMTPFSTDEVAFSTVFDAGLTTTYRFDFAHLQTSVGTMWESITPVSTPELEYLRSIAGAMSVELFDSAGNNFSFTSEGESTIGNIGFANASSDRPFIAAEIGYINDRQIYLDKSGCQMNDAGCGVEVTKIFPFHITNIFYSYDPASVIPEPQTYVLMLMGLGLLGLVSHGRKASLALKSLSSNNNGQLSTIAAIG